MEKKEESSASNNLIRELLARIEKLEREGILMQELVNMSSKEMNGPLRALNGPLRRIRKLKLKENKEIVMVMASCKIGL